MQSSKKFSASNFSLLLNPLKILTGKTHSNKIEALKKSMNLDIWVIGTLNELFKRGSYTQIRFSKKVSS